MAVGGRAAGTVVDLLTVGGWLGCLLTLSRVVAWFGLGRAGVSFTRGGQAQGRLFAEPVRALLCPRARALSCVSVSTPHPRTQRKQRSLSSPLQAPIWPLPSLEFPRYAELLYLKRMGWPPAGCVGTLATGQPLQGERELVIIRGWRGGPN